MHFLSFPQPHLKTFDCFFSHDSVLFSQLMYVFVFFWEIERGYGNWHPKRSRWLTAGVRNVWFDAQIGRNLKILFLIALYKVGLARSLSFVSGDK